MTIRRGRLRRRKDHRPDADATPRARSDIASAAWASGPPRNGRRPPGNARAGDSRANARTDALSASSIWNTWKSASSRTAASVSVSRSGPMGCPSRRYRATTPAAASTSCRWSSRSRKRVRSSAASRRFVVERSPLARQRGRRNIQEAIQIDRDRPVKHTPHDLRRRRPAEHAVQRVAIAERVQRGDPIAEFVRGAESSDAQFAAA